MKAIVDQRKLQRGLNMVVRAVDTKPFIEAFAGVFIEATDGCLRLSATNQEMAITCWLPCETHETGSAVVPARLLNDYVGNLIASDLIITSCEGDRSVKVYTNSSEEPVELLLGSYLTEDYPVLSTIDPSSSHVLTARVMPKLLSDMIKRVAYASAPPTSNDNPVVLTGTEFTFTSAHLILCATDQNRLVRRSSYAVDKGMAQDAWRPLGSAPDPGLRASV